MYLKNRTLTYTKTCSPKEQIEKLKELLKTADAVLIGAGAGLSASAGLTYSGERFLKEFRGYKTRYGFSDMYSGSFYPFETPEEYWAYMSRFILVNRYDVPQLKVYQDLLDAIQDKDYFVLTTNVDHQFQLSNFSKRRLFYTQGDYGLFQCSMPCCQETYDNESIILRMAAEQKDFKIPPELIPKCPVCTRPMMMNLRSDGRFVEDSGWHKAFRRYEAFLKAHKNSACLFLELGVGNNTPGIIKYPFWQMTAENANAAYACVNLGEAFCPNEIADRALCINGDIGFVLQELKKIL